MPERAVSLPSAFAGQTGRRHRVLSLVTLLAVLAISLVVRVRYAEPELSYDELWNLAMTAGRGSPFTDVAPDQLYLTPRSEVLLADAAPPWAIWTHMTDRHPPLYIVTLRLWRAAFGESGHVAQAYTWAWSCIFTAFAFAIARQTMGLTIAALLGLAQAFAPTQVYLGQEVRDYEMMIAIGAIAVWMMTRIELAGASRRRAILLGLLPLPLLLTHYFTLGSAVAIGVFGCWRLVGQRRAFIAALAASATAYAVVWLPFALRQIVEVQDDAYVHLDHRDLLVEAMLAATAPYRLLVDLKIVQQPLSASAGALFALPWFLTRRLPALRPWTLWLTFSVAALVVLDESRSTIHLGFARYASAATPAVLPLAAGCAYAIRRWLAVVVSAGLVVLCGYELRVGTWIASDCPQFAPATHHIAELARPGEGVLVFPAYLGPAFGEWMMLQCSAEPGLFPRPTMKITRPVSVDVARALPRRAWLVAPPFDGPIDALIPSARILSRWDMNATIRVSYIEIADGTASDAAATTPSRIR